MPEGDAAIELRGFSYRYPGAAGPALREVDLRIEAGEMVVLSGRTATCMAPVRWVGIDTG